MIHEGAMGQLKPYWVLNAACDPSIVTLGSEIKLSCTISRKLSRDKDPYPLIEVYAESGKLIRTVEMGNRPGQDSDELEATLRAEYGLGTYLAIIRIGGEAPSTILTFTTVDQNFVSAWSDFSRLLEKRIKARDAIDRRDYALAARYLSEILKSYTQNNMRELAELALIEFEAVLPREHQLWRYSWASLDARAGNARQLKLSKSSSLDNNLFTRNPAAGDAENSRARWTYSAYESTYWLSKNCDNVDKSIRYYETATLLLASLADTFYAKPALEHYLSNWKRIRLNHFARIKSDILSPKNQYLGNLVNYFVCSVGRYSSQQSKLKVGVKSFARFHSIEITNSGIPIERMGSTKLKAINAVKTIDWWHNLFDANGCKMKVQWDSLKNVTFAIDVLSKTPKP